MRRLLAHYEKQTEDEAVAEDESVWQDPKTTISLLADQLPRARELIAKHRPA